MTPHSEPMKCNAMIFHTSAPTRPQVVIALEGAQVEEMDYSLPKVTFTCTIGHFSMIQDAKD